MKDPNEDKKAEVSSEVGVEVTGKSKSQEKREAVVSAANRDKLVEQAEKLGVEVTEKMKAEDIKQAIRDKRAEAQSAAESDGERTVSPKRKAEKAEQPQKPKTQEEPEQPNLAVVNTTYQVNFRFRGKDYVGVRFVVSPEEAADLRVALVDRYGRDVLKK